MNRKHPYKIRKDSLMNWQQYFDDREIKEINYSILYQNMFNHGTSGHHEKIIIAKMAALLNRYQEVDKESPIVEKVKATESVSIKKE